LLSKAARRGSRCARIPAECLCGRRRRTRFNIKHAQDSGRESNANRRACFMVERKTQAAFDGETRVCSVERPPDRRAEPNWPEIHARSLSAPLAETLLPAGTRIILADKRKGLYPLRKRLLLASADVSAVLASADVSAAASASALLTLSRISETFLRLSLP